MNKGLLTSIIVPIYNVEKYLDECIRSLVSQTYQNLEIFLVDDGSKDKSGELADRWSEKDERIKVIHQKNQGLSGARNTGLENATGEYIMFVDSDDYVAETYVEELVETLEKENAELSMCGFFSTQKDGTRLATRLPNGSTCLSSEQYFEKFYTFSGHYSAVWNKCYKRSLFDGIRFDVGKTNEDARIMLKLIPKANKIAYTPQGLYFYRRRKTSIMNDRNKDRLLQSESEWILMHYDYHNQKGNRKFCLLALKLYFNKTLEYYIYLSKDARKRVRRELRRVKKELLRYKELRLRVKFKIIFCNRFPLLYSWYWNRRTKKELQGFFE